MGTRRAAAPAKTGLDAIRAWVVFWLSLHDLGKFPVSFQGQRADLVARLLVLVVRRARCLGASPSGAGQQRQQLLFK